MELKKWNIAGINWNTCQQMAAELSVSPITAQLLINRGILSASDGRLFLFGSLRNLQSPYEMLGVSKAVERVADAIRNKEIIAVFGDYDADGITATAIMVDALELLGAKVLYYIPERVEEGYSLNNNALEHMAAERVALVITVDCGIKSHQEIIYGKALGLDFIITDHHEPGVDLPLANAIVNPKLPGQNCTPLAGAGVAFKLCQALFELFDVPPEHGIRAGQYLDLVVLGTIADIVPLIGDNRLLVKYGLPLLNTSRRLGINSLIEAAGLKGRPLTISMVSYGLIPRINAAGRVSHAAKAVELLLTNSSQKAMELARQLDRENGTRQIMEQQITSEAISLAESLDLEREKIIVLSSDFWHQGVIGIASAKLVEKYNRPVILFSINGNNAKGSGRSIAGFSLSKILDSCKDLILNYGGHDLAAGLSIEKDKIEALKARLNAIAEQMDLASGSPPVLFVDCEITFEAVDMKLVEEIELVGPFGPDNPEPLFVSWRIFPQKLRAVGKNGNHLRMSLQEGNVRLEGIGFNLLKDGIKVSGKEEVAIVYAINKNHWQGQDSLQLVIKDIKPNVIPETNYDFFHNELAVLDPEIRDCLTAWFGGENKTVCFLSSELLKGIALLSFLEWQEAKTCTLIVTETVSQLDAYANRLRDFFSSAEFPIFCGYGTQTENEVADLLENMENYTGIIIVSASFWREYQNRLRSLADRIAFLFVAADNFNATDLTSINTPLLAVKGQNNENSLVNPAIEWERLYPCSSNLTDFEQVISARGPIWLLVKNEIELQTIRKYILERNLIPAKQVLCWSPRNHWRQKFLISRMLCASEDYLVLSTISADFWIKKCNRVIIWNIPFSPSDLMHFLSWGKEVFLMLKHPINNEDQPPFRTKYGIFYNGIIKAGVGDRQYLLKEVLLNKILKESGIYYNHLTVGAPALAVLEELGLLKLEKQGSNILIGLLPVPEEKKKLEDSWRYLEYCSENKYYHCFQKLIHSLWTSKAIKTLEIPDCG